MNLQRKNSTTTTSTVTRVVSRRSILIGAVTASIGLLLVGCALLSSDIVIRLSDGVIDKRVFLAGFRVGSLNRVSALAPFDVSRSDSGVDGQIIVSSRASLWRSGPAPSRYGARLLTQCQTVSRLLGLSNVSESEVKIIWVRIAQKAVNEEPIGGIIDSLLSTLEDR